MKDSCSQLTANNLQNPKEFLSIGLISTLKKISRFWKKPDPITTKEELGNYLSLEIANITGLAIMKYSQKRLGKIHYNIVKDKNYASELVDCQIKLHAEIISDIGHLVMQLLKYQDFSECKELRSLLEQIHNDYVSSSPEGMDFSSCLNTSHFLSGEIKFRERASKTGKFLFNTLPMTDIMLSSDVAIFQGQIRFAYIRLLEKLGKCADYEKIRNSLDTT